MKLTEIQDLIKFVSKSGVTEVEIEQSNFKITIKSDPFGKKGKKGQQQPEAYMQPQMPMAMPQMMPQQQQQQQPQQQQQHAGQSPEKKEEGGKDDSNYVTVKSPMIGTFYRSSSPDKDPFVQVGDDIKPEKVICIIEAMKLFNEIEAELAGKVVKVLVDDASPVEYDTPLFLIDPA
jgi:acetyl-CoA carboxylase biotin carboxyl carrier protein